MIATVRAWIQTFLVNTYMLATETAGEIANRVAMPVIVLAGTITLTLVSLFLGRADYAYLFSMSSCMAAIVLSAIIQVSLSAVKLGVEDKKILGAIQEAKSFFGILITVAIFASLISLYVAANGVSSLDARDILVIITLVIFLVTLSYYIKIEAKLAGYVATFLAGVMLLGYFSPTFDAKIKRLLRANREYSYTTLDRMSLNQQARSRSSFLFLTEDAELYKNNGCEGAPYCPAGRKILMNTRVKVFNHNEDLTDGQSEVMAKVEIGDENGVFTGSGQYYYLPRRVLTAKIYHALDTPPEMPDFSTGWIRLHLNKNQEEKLVIRGDCQFQYKSRHAFTVNDFNYPATKGNEIKFFYVAPKKGNNIIRISTKTDTELQYRIVKKS